MYYCPDCEIYWDDEDVDDAWVDEYGTPWCPCGCELESFDPSEGYNLYDTLEEKYL